MEEIRAQIATTAREIWERRGRVDGNARDDWMQAERQVMEETLDHVFFGQPHVVDQHDSPRRSVMLSRHLIAAVRRLTAFS